MNLLAKMIEALPIVVNDVWNDGSTWKYNNIVNAALDVIADLSHLTGKEEEKIERRVRCIETREQRELYHTIKEKMLRIKV